MRCMWQKVMMVNVITTENENEGDKNDNEGDKNGNKGDKNALSYRIVTIRDDNSERGLTRGFKSGLEHDGMLLTDVGATLVTHIATWQKTYDPLFTFLPQSKDLSVFLFLDTFHIQ